MPLITDTAAVNNAAVQEAKADAAVTSTEASTEAAAVAAKQAEADAQVEAARAAAAASNESVLDEPEAPAPVIEQPAQATSQAVATANQNTSVTTQRQASQSAVLHELANEGHEGLKIDFSSFPGIVLKDGEFQLTGSTRCFNAQLGFDGIVTGSKEKFAMRVGGDDDGDVVFSDHKADFENPETEVGKKVAEWRVAGLKPELKTYLEAYTMITNVADEAAADLVGELVVVQVSPTSVGRYSGYVATQMFKHKVSPSGFVTHFGRGEKITSGKFPYYPWSFKFVELA